MKKLNRRDFFKEGLKAGTVMIGMSALADGFLPKSVGHAAKGEHAQSSPSWKFAVISDSHDSDMFKTKTGVTPYLTPIINDIITEKPDFVLQTGDLITGAQTQLTSPVYRKYDMQYANYQQVTAPLSQAGIPLFVVRGNHDYGLRDKNQELAQAYMAQETGRMPQNGPPEAKGLSYSFIHKNIKFIMIDQFVDASDGIVTLPMDWVKAELENSHDVRHIFVMGHSPVFSPNTSSSSNNNQFNLFAQPTLQDQFWSLLTEHHVTAYVSGHQHLYFRGQANGTAQIVVGNMGGPMISYNPATVDSRLTSVFPTTPVPSTGECPGYAVFTVDEGNKSITAADYWLDSNNNKYVYDTFSVA